jgi:glycosyltransferase involved in cell wall biosynthesis
MRMDKGRASERPTGVSVVVCCHNSTERLSPTLAHLAAQQVPDGLDWEVLLIDNMSTDGTADLARSLWPADAGAPLRVIVETQIGTTAARCRGLAEARYEFVTLVDDDNWVCPDWVRIVAEVMQAHPEIGACGGLNEAVCEGEAPAWFEAFKKSYVIGPQADEGGFMTAEWASLWGAGICIRWSAWEQLLSSGWQHLLGGRLGASLTGCDDLELSYALRFAGWALWYEPRLRLQHFLPARRLQWSYLRRLHRGGGASAVGLDPYAYIDQGEARGLKARLRRTWQWQALSTVNALLPYGPKAVLSAYRLMEGDAEVLRIEGQLGRLFELLRRRSAYQAGIRELVESAWVRSNAMSTPAALARQH